MKANNKEILCSLNEKFVPLGIKTIDSKNRITLGEKILKLITAQTRANEFQIFYGEEGDILLRPMVSIPSKEVWVYRNPEVFKRIRQGLTEAKEGKVEKAKDIDKFLKSL
ncbi:MAG: hypothetical protein FJZ16_01100 [Candidatus Omnitrophica bacterium]|nr:hypothetical protein [Candidatus Omnitrophota bacterium]